MPGTLEIRVTNAPMGRTPCKSLLAWLENALEIDEAGHKADAKPYAVSMPHGTLRITVNDMEIMQRIVEYTQKNHKHAFNGEWAKIEVTRAHFIPTKELIENAPPRTEMRVSTLSPAVFSNHGQDDPFLNKQRLFDTIRRRWKLLEPEPQPEFSSTENAELYAFEGKSVPYKAHVMHRGFMGHLDLKLHGTTECICAGNALLAYGELWGIGKAITVGAGVIEVRSLPRRRRAA